MQAIAHALSTPHVPTCEATSPRMMPSSTLAQAGCRYRFAVADAAQDGAPQVVGLDVVTAEQVDVVGVLHPCTSACLTNAYPRPSATLKYLKK
eukprot:365661-Chlamydomonas_euryale.AAC.21